MELFVEPHGSFPSNHEFNVFPFYEPLNDVMNKLREMFTCAINVQVKNLKIEVFFGTCM